MGKVAAGIIISLDGYLTGPGDPPVPFAAFIDYRVNK
jgi:hypothetical protein